MHVGDAAEELRRRVGRAVAVVVGEREDVPAAGRRAAGVIVEGDATKSSPLGAKAITRAARAVAKRRTQKP